MNSKVIASISDLIEPILANDGMELVDIEHESAGKRKVLRLLIYKPGGVNIEDCKNVSRMVKPLLDVNEMISDSYILEVASPGIDRPLKTEADFRRTDGHTIKVITNRPINNCKEFVGKVNHLEDGIIELINSSGKRIQIPIAQIDKARQEIEF